MRPTENAARGPQLAHLAKPEPGLKVLATHLDNLGNCLRILESSHADIAEHLGIGQVQFQTLFSLTYPSLVLNKCRRWDGKAQLG